MRRHARDLSELNPWLSPNFTASIRLSCSSLAIRQAIVIKLRSRLKVLSDATDLQIFCERISGETRKFGRGVAWSKRRLRVLAQIRADGLSNPLTGNLPIGEDVLHDAERCHCASFWPSFKAENTPRQQLRSIAPNSQGIRDGIQGTICYPGWGVASGVSVVGPSAQFMPPGWETETKPCWLRRFPPQSPLGKVRVEACVFPKVGTGARL